MHEEEAQPVVAIRDLKPETRKFLDSLDEEDLHDWKEALVLARRLKSWGIVTRWLLMTGAAVVIGFAAFGDAMVRILGWMRGH